MTEEQYIKLVEVGDYFWNELGSLAAKCISQFPEEIEFEVVTHLQELCSIYGTTYNKKIQRENNHGNS